MTRLQLQLRIEERGSWTVQVRGGVTVSGVTSWGVREGFLWAEASGVLSGCEFFCSEVEAGVVSRLSPFSIGQGKKLGKLSLLLETVFVGSLILAKQRLCRLL